MERKNGGNQKFKRIASLLCVIMLVSVLAACTGANSPNKEEKRVLRIGVVQGDRYSGDYLRTQYTDTFQMLNKNIDIEVVNAIDYSQMRYNDNEEDQLDPLEEMEKLMTGDNPPDIVMLDYSQLAHFVNQNMLTPLDGFISEDEFDIEGYAPAVIDGLKAIGNNNLYALAPQFTSNALVYNRGVFEEIGVELPTDNMTWDDVFELARQVAHGEGVERVYGFNFTSRMYNSLLDNISVYTAPLNMQMMDEEQETLLVDSQQWIDTLNKIMGLYDEDIIPSEQKMYEMRREMGDAWGNSMFSYDLFLSGKLAMAIIDYYQLSDIISANQNAQNIENFDPIQWDVVTVPVHPEYPNVGGFVDMSPIMAINANAANVEDAWELIKFINSKEWAELKSRSSRYLLSREEYIKTIDGLNYNIKAFTQLIPAENPNSNRYMYDDERYWRIENMGRNILDQVINKDLELEEGLKQWKTQGDALIKAIKENPDTPIYELENQIMMESMKEVMIE